MTVLTSRFGEESQRGTPEQLTKFYESKAYQAQRENNEILAQNYFQHAEHYKRITNERKVK